MSTGLLLWVHVHSFLLVFISLMNGWIKIFIRTITFNFGFKYQSKQDARGADYSHLQVAAQSCYMLIASENVYETC
jgi:hypothetical protein